MTQQPPTPVLVVHGIAQRKRDKVEADVARMNEALGDQYELIPVYWGDLGADDEHLDRLMGRYEQRAEGFWSMAADSALRPVVKSWGKSLSWVTKRRGDRELAAEIRDLSRRNAELMDERVRGYVNDRFQSMRRWMTGALLPWIADVMVYQSHSYRRKIHERVRQVMAERLPPQAGTAAMPLHVIAHSLGGIIIFDMAMAEHDPLHIQHLVTLGSQPAFFHVIDPRGSLTPFAGTPVTLPPNFRGWTNIWDQHDMLAFSVGEVFRLHDGKLPREMPVRCFRSTGLFRSHQGYWTRTAALRCIRKALDEAD